MEMDYAYYITIYLSIGALISLYIEKTIHNISKETGTKLPPINSYMRIRMMVMWPIFAIESLF